MSSLLSECLSGRELLNDPTVTNMAEKIKESLRDNGGDLVRVGRIGWIAGGTRGKRGIWSRSRRIIRDRARLIMIILGWRLAVTSCASL